MQDNARWRDQQRVQNVSKYRKEEADEEEQLRNRKDTSGSSFISAHLRAAAGAGSVEGRIKANRHNIQRGHSSMDSNFAKR